MTNSKVILAIETSTSACSVALKVGGDIDQLYEEGNNLHSKRLLEMVDQLLDKNSVSLNDVELIVAGVGPGAFTGLRIGVGVVQGLAYSHDIPVVGVSSLQALAQSVNVKPNECVVVGLDARMSQIYWTVFYKAVDSEITEVFESHRLNSPDEIQFINEAKNSKIAFIGNAWSIYVDGFSTELKTILHQANIIDSLPQAMHLIEYASAHNSKAKLNSFFELSPLYIRDDIAKKKTVKPLLK